MYDCFTDPGILQADETRASACSEHALGRDHAPRNNLRARALARHAAAAVKFAPVEQATDGPRAAAAQGYAGALDRLLSQHPHKLEAEASEAV
jgi:hypothetical protein